MIDEPGRRELLELDIDTRIAAIWRRMDAVKKREWTLELAAQFVRAAYAQGYQDALEEPTPAVLHRTHGYKPPRRRTP